MAKIVWGARDIDAARKLGAAVVHVGDPSARDVVCDTHGEALQLAVETGGRILSEAWEMVPCDVESAARVVVQSMLRDDALSADARTSLIGDIAMGCLNYALRAVPLVDCTAGVPARAVLSKLIDWNGGHGSYSGERLIVARTPFGDALARVVGTDCPTLGEQVTIRPAFEGGAGAMPLGMDAPIPHVPNHGAPALVMHRNLAGDWRCSLAPSLQ